MGNIRIVFKKRTRQERGSALLVTLMVLVGLSLLGLAFVATSESESAISANQRNYAQTLALAEAGAKSVAACFNSPAWCQTKNLIPTNANGVPWKRQRVLTNPPYTGFYKTDTTLMLTDKPWRPALVNRLLGSRDSPDILFDTTTASAFLNTLNSGLYINFADTNNVETRDFRVTEIRIYSPPVVGGTLNANGFWEGGTRYGVATVEVTAQRFRGSQVIARASVRATVSEWPMPAPGGPYQSSGSMLFAGDQELHWGKVTSQGPMNNFKVGDWNTSIPWHDAWEKAHYEHGYDSSDVWTLPGAGGKVYRAGDIIRPATIAAGMAISPGSPLTIEYRVTTPGTIAAGTAEPTCCSAVTNATPQWLSGDLNTAAPRTVTVGPVVFQERYPTGYPNIGAGAESQSWLYEVVQKRYGDPWLEVRSRSNSVTLSANGVPPTADPAVAPDTVSPHMFKYDIANRVETLIGKSGNSNIFRDQWGNQRPDRRQVTFPRMDYAFWKRMAVAGSTMATGGIYYLRYVTTASAGCVVGEYTDGTSCEPWEWWVNVTTTGKPGFYFFDGRENLDPYRLGALPLPLNTPPSATGGAFQMQGFFYFNANWPDTNDGPTDVYPQPAEPYRDVGYRKVDNLGQFVLDASGNPTLEGANDGGWGYQDLPFSNGAAAVNGRFDVFVAQRTVTKPGTDGALMLTNVWMPVPYYPGCTPGSNGFVGANCSEPHEPYLNIIYPTIPGNWNAYVIATMSPLVGWQDPAAVTRRPRIRSAVNAFAACTGGANASLWTPADQASCTSNAYDNNAMLRFNPGPPIDGVLYCQGTFNSDKRNFGAVLVNTNAGGGNNQQVWFDDRIRTGEWPPSTWNLPRTFISALQTEQ